MGKLVNYQITHLPISTMHPLDTPVWSALTTCQADVALGSQIARRFPPQMAAHGALAELTAEAYEALSRISLEPVGLFFPGPPQLPAGWMITRHIRMFQMVHERKRVPQIQLAPEARIVELSENDIAGMSGIYALTRPGRTIAPRIQQLGLFMGVRIEGKLIAMGGLRLHVPGYREITTVATHPDHLSRGYATALVAALMRRIYDAGESPFLHVRDDNTRAMQIYDRLGFAKRMQVDYGVCRQCSL